MQDVRVRQRLRAQAERVAFREIRLMRYHHAIAAAFYVAAPVLVVVVMVGPVTSVAVVVVVPGVEHLYLASAQIFQPPAYGLSYGKAVLCAVVEIGRTAKLKFVGIAFVDDVVDVA